jgi:hypothetical protein
MPKRISRRLQVEPQETEEDKGSSVDSLLNVILPYAPAMLKTIGAAGSATEGPEGEAHPGNVQAAAIGLDFIMKALQGRSGDRARDVLAEIRKIREASLAQEAPGG